MFGCPHHLLLGYSTSTSLSLLVWMIGESYSKYVAILYSTMCSLQLACGAGDRHHTTGLGLGVLHV
jgi:hypothetical protein